MDEFQGFRRTRATVLEWEALRLRKSARWTAIQLRDISRYVFQHHSCYCAGLSRVALRMLFAHLSLQGCELTVHFRFDPQIANNGSSNRSSGLNITAILGGGIGELLWVDMSETQFPAENST